MPPSLAAGLLPHWACPAWMDHRCPPRSQPLLNVRWHHLPRDLCHLLAAAGMPRPPAKPPGLRHSSCSILRFVAGAQSSPHQAFRRHFAPAHPVFHQPCLRPDSHRLASPHHPQAGPLLARKPSAPAAPGHPVDLLCHWHPACRVRRWRLALAAAGLGVAGLLATDSLLPALAAFHQLASAWACRQHCLALGVCPHQEPVCQIAADDALARPGQGRAGVRPARQSVVAAKGLPCYSVRAAGCPPRSPDTQALKHPQPPEPEQSLHSSAGFRRLPQYALA